MKVYIAWSTTTGEPFVKGVFDNKADAEKAEKIHCVTILEHDTEDAKAYLSGEWLYEAWYENGEVKVLSDWPIEAVEDRCEGVNECLPHTDDRTSLYTHVIAENREQAEKLAREKFEKSIREGSYTKYKEAWV
jgi:hypothetical protein